MSRPLRWQLAVGALVLVPLVAVSEEDKSDVTQNLFELSLEQLLEIKVTTVTRFAESTWQTPGHTVVMSRAQILRRGYRNVAQLIAALPSTDVLVGADIFESNRIGIRGVIGNNKFIILQDGIRLSSPTTDLVTVADNYPLLHVKQVEIVYGPASALYGADAFTGVINLISRQGNEQPGTELVVMAGNDGARGRRPAPCGIRRRYVAGAGGDPNRN